MKIKMFIEEKEMKIAIPTNKEQQTTTQETKKQEVETGQSITGNSVLSMLGGSGVKIETQVKDVESGEILSQSKIEDGNVEKSKISFTTNKSANKIIQSGEESDLQDLFFSSADSGELVKKATHIERKEELETANAQKQEIETNNIVKNQTQVEEKIETINEQVQELKQENKQLEEPPAEIIINLTEDLESKLDIQEVEDVKGHKDLEVEVVSSVGVNTIEQNYMTIDTGKFDVKTVQKVVDEIKNIDTEKQIKDYENLQKRKKDLDNQILQLNFKQERLEEDLKKNLAEVKEITGAKTVEEYAKLILNSLNENANLLDEYAKEIEEKENLIANFQKELKELENE